jgi:galactose-1-phosphate uridylyltransferase
MKNVIYTTKCPLCGDDVVVTVEANESTSSRIVGVIEFPVVCDDCKALWKKIKEEGNR